MEDELMVEDLAIILGLAIAIALLYKVYTRRATPIRAIQEPSNRNHDNHSRGTNEPEKVYVKTCSKQESPPSGTEKAITLPESNEESLLCNETETSLLERSESRKDVIQSKGETEITPSDHNEEALQLNETCAEVTSMETSSETEITSSDHNEEALQLNETCPEGTSTETSPSESKEDVIQSEESYHEGSETEITPSDHNEEALQLNETCPEVTPTETSSETEITPSDNNEKALQLNETCPEGTSTETSSETEITPSDHNEEALQLNETCPEGTSMETSPSERGEDVIHPEESSHAGSETEITQSDHNEETFTDIVQDATSENTSDVEEDQHEEGDTTKCESKDANGICDEFNGDLVDQEQSGEQNISEKDDDPPQATEYEGQDLTSQSAQLEVGVVED